MNEKTIAIDIGGTKISFAVVANGKIISDVIKIYTPDSAKAILDAVLENVGKILNEYSDVSTVAIASAGTVNLENARVVGSTGNLPKGYSDLDLTDEIKNKFGLKTFIENDANAAAYAEYKIGAAKGHNNTIVITLGTGVGGGVIVDGHLLRGKSGSAAEVGHLRMREDKHFRCTCGHYDCWEAYASGTGYARIAREEISNYPPEKKTVLRSKPLEKITSYDVLEGLNNGDELSIKIHERWQTMVLKGLISLANIFDPDSIVLSGGMAEFVDFECLQKRLNDGLVVPDVKLLPAQAGNYSGMLGAALLAQDKFLK